MSSPQDFTQKSSKEIEDRQVDHQSSTDPDAEFGGHEARVQLEKKLVRKLDARMCILIIIYILNYVRPISSCIYDFFVLTFHEDW